MGTSITKIIVSILISLALIFPFGLNVFAKNGSVEDISITLSSQSIANFLNELLPYKINMGKNFSGSLWVHSIKNFRIRNNKISFSSHLYGKDITYIAKIGKQLSSIKLGNVDLHNDWESALRFDAKKKTLYVRPHLKEQDRAENKNQQGTPLNILFKALSDIEYPIDLRQINPISAEVFGNVFTVTFDIRDISAGNNKLVLQLRPIPLKTSKNKTRAGGTSKNN